MLNLQGDDARLEYIQEHIEATWDEAHLLQTDKAWDVYSDTQTYIVNLIDHHELPEISTALEPVTKEWMQARYEQLRNTDYPHEFISEQGWQYTWDWVFRNTGLRRSR